MRKLIFIFCVLLNSNHMTLTAQVTGQLIKVQLQKEVFTDDFFLLLQEGAREHLDIYDAAKISDGYVSIAGFSSTQGRLSIDARPFPEQQQQVDLIVKGYTPGNYTLIIDPERAGGRLFEMHLVDRLLNKNIAIGTEHVRYEFYLDSVSLDGSGVNRFSLVWIKVDPASIQKPLKGDMLAFPNPFVEKISLNVRENDAAEADVRILDIQGKVCLRFKFSQVIKDQILEIPCGDLPSGIYLLEWKSGTQVKTLKIIKI